MSMIHALFLGILPASLLMWFGNRVHLGVADEKSRNHWLTFLLGGLSLSLIAFIVAYSINDYAANLFIATLLPVNVGFIAGLTSFFLSDRMAWSRESLKVMPLFLLVILLMAWIVLSKENAGLIPAMLGGILIALAWQSWRVIKKQYVVLLVIEVLLLGFSIWVVDTNRPTQMDPLWLNFIISFGGYVLIPGAGVITSALLLRELFSHDQPLNWRKLISHLLFVVLILSIIWYQIFLTSIWEVATDGLGGIMLWLITSIVAISSAFLMAWSMPRRYIWVAVLFALTVPAIMQLAHNKGTYDGNGEWGKTPIIMTERRAGKIDRAIQQYFKRNMEYPQKLNDLTPRYILYIPNPYIIPGQDWCYESGKDYYRFGYVYRQYFSTSASVKVHSSTGEPPSPTWDCEKEAEKYPMPGFQQP